jgi:hypothetical protein
MSSERDSLDIYVGMDMETMMRSWFCLTLGQNICSIDTGQLCDNVEQSTCDKQGNPLGEPKLLGDIEDRQKEESNEDGFKQEVHLSFTSIFSYLLKLLLLDF